MSREELQRVEVLGRVASRQLKLIDAAILLELCYRQVKRLWQKYRRKGAEGLRHGNVGRRSNRARPGKFRRQVLRLVRKKYGGEERDRFGPTLAAEHLAEEDSLEVHRETLRRWMLEDGLWSRQRKRKAYRQRRERKPHFGELVQLDGSFHAWLEERGPRGCLMNMADDATSTTLCYLGDEETIWAAVGVLRAWIQRYGIPRALYTDWKNVYVREPSPKEALHGIVPVTQFGRMCQALGIRIIAARSPQAKGRIERSHGTHQDRLVKKLRRKQIRTYAAANEFVEKQYLPEHNRRFARPPAQPEDYHRKAPLRRELEDVFHLETERTVGNDWVVRHASRYFQLERAARRRVLAKAKVQVCEWEDGRLEIRYRGESVGWREIAAPTPMPRLHAVLAGQPRKRWTPPRHHPWRQYATKIELPAVVPSLQAVAAAAR